MLTLDDCIGLCDLTEEEIQAIAEHEHVPEIVAAELGNYLVVTPGGQRRIRRIILDDIAAAQARGDKRHTLRLELVLRHFCDTHPDYRKSADEAVAATL
jgi:hypothetical protein